MTHRLVICVQESRADVALPPRPPADHIPVDRTRTMCIIPSGLPQTPDGVLSFALPAEHRTRTGTYLAPLLPYTDAVPTSSSGRVIYSPCGQGLGHIRTRNDKVYPFQRMNRVCPTARPHDAF